MTAYVLLALAGFVAGYVNTVAGAGSLLTLPALIFSGLDASAANATNRVAVLFQTAGALASYRADRAPLPRGAALLCVPAGAGAAAGALVATLLTAAQVRASIVAAMLVMLPLSLVPRRAPASGGAAAPVAATPAMHAAFAAIGFYGGFLQAGVGIVVLLVMTLAFRADLVSSNHLKSLVTFAFALVSLAVFALRREPIDLPRGAALAVATTLGGWAGARAAVRLSEKWIRAAVVASVLASAAKLVADIAR